MAQIDDDRRLTDRAFALLRALAETGTREWYAAHKAEFDREVLTPFAAILEAISFRLRTEDMEFSGGRKTLFRLNRDTRFSKDKSPYKTNVAGMLTPSGTKQTDEGFVYLHAEAGGGFAAFGRYGLSPQALGPIRDRVVAEPERVSRILAALAADGLALDRTGALKSMPRGYAEHRDHPHADILKLKNLIVRVDIPISDWKSGAVIDRAGDAALRCRALIRFVSV
ncbi:MAG: DUF2461 domain-containing protein [Pseudomonadota bacterium]